MSVCVLVLGCTPTFNWREVSLLDGGLQALFPCKPQRSARAEARGGGPLRSELLSCRADEWTFAVGHSDASKVADAAPLIEAMRLALATNSGGRETAAQSVAVSGSHARAKRIAVSGRSRDGQPVEVQAQLFERDGTLVQASIVGRRTLPAELASNFFDGLRWTARR